MGDWLRRRDIRNPFVDDFQTGAPHERERVKVRAEELVALHRSALRERYE
jgi:hypothetical protein